MTGPEATVLAAVLAALIASLPAWAAFLTARATRAAVNRQTPALTQAIDAQTTALKDHITATAAAADPQPSPAPPEGEAHDRVHR